MTAPLCTVIIPTSGRATLANTLRSIRVQAPARDCELVVVGDTHQDTFAAALAAVPVLCADHGARYVGHDGGVHCVGQPQRQAGMALAAGRWLMWSQDDACWAVGAWEAIRAALTTGPRVPHVFQVQTWQAGVVPRRHALALGNMDADGCAVPNDPAKLGTWPNVYEGDWRFMAETCELYGCEPVFVDTVIAVGRPQPSRDWGVNAVAVAR